MKTLIQHILWVLLLLGIGLALAAIDAAAQTAGPLRFRPAPDAERAAPSTAPDIKRRAPAPVPSTAPDPTAGTCPPGTPKPAQKKTPLWKRIARTAADAGQREIKRRYPSARRIPRVRVP